MPSGQDGENSLTPLMSADEGPTEGDHGSSVVTIDPRAIPAKEVPSKDQPPALTPVHETDAVSEIDDGAMDVDQETAGHKSSVKFSTPGPRVFLKEEQYSNRQCFTQGARDRRATYDFHQISMDQFAEHDRENQNTHQ